METGENNIREPMVLIMMISNKNNTITYLSALMIKLWFNRLHYTLFSKSTHLFLKKGSLCPLCSNKTESNAYLFFSCRKSLQVWAYIRDLIAFCRRFTSSQRIIDSLIRDISTSGVQGKLCCLIIAITVYCI